ncbi:transcription antitermination protein nusG [Chitinophaga niastensis]|uniref:Transcription antitermination protein nusG n=1 Tax=Chitinophaga niastensis TaxID=536980 RepID=A0A2P8HPQ9_CHINA|nr:UpxY family transcription antiterminator [Chitinophaga niastensis]PSL48191.1 transcription antitermination protein nusG [Chitinophaga niastensis]
MLSVFMREVPSLAEKKWYVVYTRPKYEKKVLQSILSQEIECYLPVRVELKQWSDRIKRMQSPIFPNYLFVKINLENKVKILRMEGVIYFVGFDGQPVTVSEDEIEKIKRIESRGGEFYEESYYCIGDKVRVVHGIFSGMEGILLRKSNQVRFVIKLPVISQAVSVEIESCDVERI